MSSLGRAQDSRTARVARGGEVFWRWDESLDLTGYQRKVERPWAHSLLRILGRGMMPRSTAVLCTDSQVARPRGTKVRREVVLIRVLNSLGGNRDY